MSLLTQIQNTGAKGIYAKTFDYLLDFAIKQGYTDIMLSTHTLDEKIYMRNSVFNIFQTSIILKQRRKSNVKHRLSSFNFKWF